MKIFPVEEIIKKVSQISNNENLDAYVIGGYVRDYILNRHSKDIDIVVVGNGIRLAKKVAKSLGARSNISVYKNFGTAMIKSQDYEIEFVGARKESYRKDSRKPIVEDGSLEDDQRRRDFTINALAISLKTNDYGTVIDPFNGLDDIEQKRIRTPLDPYATFDDDPLRMLRAIRFAAQLDFFIDQATFRAIQNNKDRITIVSKERIVDELHKIILAPVPSTGFTLLSDSGLLAYIFPELEALKGKEIKEGRGHKDNFLHTIKVLDNIAQWTDKLWLRWAALLHDIGKPKTKKYSPEEGWTFHGHDYVGSKMIPHIFRTMRLPLNEKMKYVQKLLRLHQRPMVLSSDEVTDSAVRRLLFEAGDDIDELMLLCEADITSQNESLKKQFLKNFQLVRNKLHTLEEKDAIRNFQPPISGEEIMKAFNIPPGKNVGIIKNAIKNAILDGEIGNNYKEAFEYMRKKGEELGLTVKNEF